MSTLLIDRLQRFRSSFPGPHLDLVIESMLAGNTAGELHIVSQNGEELVLVLWDKGNDVFYVSSELEPESVKQSRAADGVQRLLKAAAADGVTRFSVRALTPSIERSLRELFPSLELRFTPTLLFKVAGEARMLPAYVAVPNLRIVALTSELLLDPNVTGTDDVRGEIQSMWPSEDLFFRRGFGAAALLDEGLVGWCTSEYVSASTCGIGVATSPAFQRKGVASAMASQVVTMARDRAITAFWECAKRNVPSIRVAERVGFTLEAEEAYWVGSLTALT